MSDYPRFTGNCPKIVSKDAKYAIRTGQRGPVVAIVYRTGDGERWHATTDDHPHLVKMVNDVKTSQGDAPNGPFYINEYHQVIVPVGSDAIYYLAGEYEKPLIFEFEGKTLCGDAVDLNGERLTPGHAWVGPHPGIPYVLKAGGKDVYYRMSPRPNVTKDIFLSGEIGAQAALEFSRGIRSMKGFDGGRFYVNEWRQMFAPVERGGEYEYVYLGELKMEDGWFKRVG